MSKIKRESLSKLKKHIFPCPFCGADEYIEYGIDEVLCGSLEVLPNDDGDFYVFCHGCFACGPPSLQPSKAKAIRTWNRRANWAHILFLTPSATPRADR